MLRAFGTAVCLSIALASTPALGAATKKKILYVTKTAGFHHSACEHSVPVFEKLAAATGFLEVVATNEVKLVNARDLAGFDAVVFSNTSGPKSGLGLSDDDAKALLDWIRGGKAFVGIHAATDSMADYAPYVEMIGASFHSHPWTKRVKVDVEDPGHPAAVFLPSPWYVEDEIYAFKEWSRDKVHVILSLDVGPEAEKGHRADRDYGLAWCRAYGEGRVFYTALGHRHEVWDDPLYQKHLMAGLLWALKMPPQEVLLAVDPDVQTDDEEEKDRKLPAAPDYPPQPGRKKPGEWTRIFDGKTLAFGKDWETSAEKEVTRKHWTVQPGGILQGDSRGSPAGASHLYYLAKEYRDFEYRAEVCVNAEGNSGMYVRCVPGNFRDGRWSDWPAGIEAQINNGWDPDPRKSGSIYPEPSVRAADLARYLGYSKEKDDGNFWFTQHVIAVGEHIVVKLNGKVVADAYRSGPREGYFAFQMHHHGAIVKFRNIEVRELPD
ncbi:MAG: ThuA domain-containing protein [Planctomycetota bacterium]